MTRCRTCRARITWATLPSGRRIPIDPDPKPDGTIRLEADGQATVPNSADAAAARLAGEDLYLPHFESCIDPTRVPDLPPVRHNR